MLVDVAHSSLWRVLHEHHLQQVQALPVRDHCERELFCQWLLQYCDTDTNFPTVLIVTDEARFTRGGIQSFQSASVGR
jgi:hypothetical protein